jgi:plasmid stabilization system protein ParE
VKPRRVRFTTTAEEHVRREKTWWLENRIHTEIFATELEEAVKVLAVLPGAGTPYPDADVVGLRRIYLRKIACHIYYTFDHEDVLVRALWGARRGRGPGNEP